MSALLIGTGIVAVLGIFTLAVWRECVPERVDLFPHDLPDEAWTIRDIETASRLMQRDEEDGRGSHSSNVRDKGR